MITVVLAAAAGVLALRLDRYFLLLLAAMFYLYAIQMTGAAYAGPLGSVITSSVSGGYLILLYLPPLLFACAAVITAAMPLRSRVLLPTDPGKPGPT